MALTVALEAPSRVERLVLIAPAGLGDQRTVVVARDLGALGQLARAAAACRIPCRRPAVKAALRGFLEDRLVHDTRAMGEVIDHFVHLHGGPRELRHLIDTGRVADGRATRAAARAQRELEMPVHDAVGHARTGSRRPSTRTPSRRSCRTREVKVLENCGHYPQLELPARVTRDARRVPFGEAQATCARSRNGTARRTNGS